MFKIDFFGMYDLVINQLFVNNLLNLDCMCIGQLIIRNIHTGEKKEYFLRYLYLLEHTKTRKRKRGEWGKSDLKEIGCIQRLRCY